MVLNGRYFFSGVDIWSTFRDNVENHPKNVSHWSDLIKKWIGIDGLDHNWQELERNYVLNQSKKTYDDWELS